MIGFLKAAQHRPRLAEDEIHATYSRLRWQIFAGIFFGYAGFYLVRLNFNLAMPDLVRQGHSRGDLGLALSGVSLAYGFSKFLMGSVSDRSNPRYFLVTGLLLSAAISLIMGLVPWATSSIAIMFAMLFLNGWFQGMGWPPCGRTMVHWWSHKERGRIVSIWNVAHNVGGGLIGPLFVLGMSWFNDWHSAFYVPAVVAIGVALFALLTLRDTPQSVGLPSVEDYKNDYPEDYDATHEREFTTREILLNHVLNNKLLWWIAGANIFVYLIRYGVLSWAPTYLQEAKHFTMEKSSWAYFLYEWAGIPGTILCGWISDRFFRGRRGIVGILFMTLVFVAVTIYWLNPPGNPGIDIAALIAVGFLIYGPVMLIGLHALELVPKKAAGTAAGFTGLFGYVGGSLAANAMVGYAVDWYGWDGGFILLLAACALAILCMLPTLRHDKGRTA